ncbi:uncharacterized protein LOC144632993 isoform X1 [Oculina patagonica]
MLPFSLWHEWIHLEWIHFFFSVYMRFNKTHLVLKNKKGSSGPDHEGCYGCLSLFQTLEQLMYLAVHPLAVDPLFFLFTCVLTRQIWLSRIKKTFLMCFNETHLALKNNKDISCK